MGVKKFIKALTKVAHPPIMDGLQEALAKIETLEARLSALEK